MWVRTKLGTLPIEDVIEGKMNRRYSDLGLPAEMQRRIPSLGDSLFPPKV
jgi:hypothetical protein